MFKSLVIATALFQVSGTQILAEDHKTRAINPAMVDEINVMIKFIFFYLNHI